MYLYIYIYITFLGKGIKLVLDLSPQFSSNFEVNFWLHNGAYLERVFATR